MANIFLDVEKGIVAAAKDVLHFVSGAQGVVTKAASAEPAVVAAIGVVFGAVATAVADIAGAVETPLNIALDVQTVTDLKAVWPDIESFLTSIGVKL